MIRRYRRARKVMKMLAALEHALRSDWREIRMYREG